MLARFEGRLLAMMVLLSLAFFWVAAPVVEAGDLDELFARLKEADAKKDTAQIKKLAVETAAAAREYTATPAPADPSEKETWAGHVAHARDVATFAEYTLYSAAARGDAATTVDLLSTLEQVNPKSKYLDEAYGRYIVALNQTGGSSKIVPVAEKGLANFPNNEDLLLIMADYSMNRKQSDRALQYAERLVAVLPAHQKPQGMGAPEWERKRTVSLGRARWICGMVHSEKSQFFEADKDLRQALPLVQDNEAMLASTLFYLGVSNYQLGRAALNKAQVLEAAKFSDQASRIKGPFADQAWRNAQIMRAEGLKMR